MRTRGTWRAEGTGDARGANGSGGARGTLGARGAKESGGINRQPTLLCPWNHQPGQAHTEYEHFRHNSAEAIDPELPPTYTV